MKAMKLQVAPKGYPHFHSLSIFSIPSKKVWMTASKKSESEYQPSFFSCSSCRKRNLNSLSMSSRAFSPFIKSNIAFCLNDDAKIIIFWWFTKHFKEKNHLLIIFHRFPLRGWRNGSKKQPGSSLPYQTIGSHSVLRACEQNGMGSQSIDNDTKKAAPKGCFLAPCLDYSEINCISISEILDLMRSRIKPINSSKTNRFDNVNTSLLL